MQQCTWNVFSNTAIKITTTLIFLYLSGILVHFFLCLFFFSAGDVGIFSLFNTGGLQRMLPAGRGGLLLLAHRNKRPWLTGVQPQGVGTGDGRERISLPRSHQVKLRLTGMMGHENLLKERMIRASSLSQKSNPEA